MSSDFPPQLQLRLPPSTTSFKRSFEEFGFDLPSPSGSESTGSTSNGNERNKRPRSASSHSDNEDSPGSSQSSSASSSSTSYSHSSQNSLIAGARSALSATRPSSSSATNEVHPASSSSRPFHEIPVLPNPAIQDVDMLSFLAPDAQNTQSSRTSPAASPPVLQPNEQLRLSLERFNTFDTEIAALRRAHSLVPRTTTPPPTLPPLMLSDDQPDLSAAALPYLHPAHRTDALESHSHGTEGSMAGSSRVRRVDMLNRGDVHPRISDSRSFQFDLHIDPRLQPSQRSQNSISLASPGDSPIHVSSESWEQRTPTAGDPVMSGLEFASIRDRLDSALEPLRSASPLVPGLVEPRSPLPAPPRASRTTAPTLPPLRTQLQQPWDDLSYRTIFYGPSTSTTNNHGREGLVNENRSPSANTSVRNPLSYWNEATYGISERLNASSIAGDRDREPVPHDLLPPLEHSNGNTNTLGIQTMEQFQLQNAPMYEELDVDPIPSLEGQRNPSQQLPSSSTESLSRSSPDGYVSSEDWFPMLRRRSAWRVLDSDEEERLSAEARRMRLLAEQREAPRTSRSALASASLDSSNSTTPWLNFGERRRSTSSRAPSSVLRPAPSSDRHVSISTPFDGVHFWDDTDSDRMSGHTTESDTWAGTEHYPRSTRADVSQRLERLADDTTHGYESTRPSLLRSNTSASTLAAFNRLRNRFYHSSSTRFASSSSLVTENSFEFRRRSARQEWMERWSRLNDERAQNQSESRPSRPIVSDASASGEPRRPELRINTRMPLDRRLFGSADGTEETRRAPEADPFNFQNDNLLDRFASLPRPMQWEYRPIQRPSSPVQPSSARSSLNASLPPGQWEYRPIQRPSSPAQLSSARAPLNSSSAPGQWEYRPIPRPSSPVQSNSARASLNVSSAPGQWEYRPIPRPSSPAQSNSARPASNVPPPPGLGTERYSRFLEYLHDYPDSSPIYPSPFNFGPIDVPHRPSEEPAVLRNARDPQGDWFSRRRHPARPSQSQIQASLWGEIDSADFGIDRTTEAGRAGAGEREREPTSAGRSSLDRHMRIDEPPRISPVRPISPYLIDVPPLPSPDLSDLFDAVPHFPPNSTHEERHVGSRPVSELSSRIRRRSPSPAVRGPQTRARLDRPGVVRSNTGFANIDPELFAPGPYRNTFQGLQRRRESTSPQASQPPSIPPFAFESSTDRELRSTRRHHSLYAESYDSRPSAQLRGDNESEPRPAHFWRSSSQSGRHYARNDWDSAAPALAAPDEHHRHREQPASSSDLHSFLSRHVRLEGARMERFAEAAQLSEASSNVSRFNHAIEVLRGDGISRRQSLDRPSAGGRASSDTPRERSSLDWLAAHHHHPHGRPRRARARRVRPLGDYMRDEDFDESYESLLSLAAAIGDVKPRCTPEEVISKLETALYNDWATPECDKRCPICLDDYSPSDTVMKVGDCAHWLHKDCLHQWLKSANTCPVCRMVVHSPRLRNRHYQRGESSSNSNDRREDSTSQINTSNMPSANTETNSFSARARFAGWPTTWRYYHP